MKVRFLLAVVVGCVVWAVASPLLLFLEARAWPDLAVAAQAYFETGSYIAFTTPMLVSFQVMWLIVNAAAGFVTQLVGKRRSAVSTVAIVLVAYFAYNHLWALWDALPTWYNVIVVLLVVPLVLAGGALARWIGARRAMSDAAAAS